METNVNVQNNSEITATNRMTLSELVNNQGSGVEIIKNPKTGKIFFTCGSITGYVSPKAQKAIEDGCGIDDLQYAEVSINGGGAVPTLMVKSKANVVRVFGSSLLK